MARSKKSKIKSMRNWFKKLFEKEKCVIHNLGYRYSSGKRDDNGYCDLIVDGKETNVRLLTFTTEQINRLQKIADKLK